MDMRDMMQNKCGPLPWALAKLNGKMRSSPRNTLISTFVREVLLVHSLPENIIKILDAMVLTQHLPTSLETSGSIYHFIL